jgi:hypothetical protein
MSSPNRIAAEYAEMAARARESATVLGHDLGNFQHWGPHYRQAACRHCGKLAQMYRKSADEAWSAPIGPALTTPCERK